MKKILFIVSTLVFIFVNHIQVSADSPFKFNTINYNDLKVEGYSTVIDTHFFNDRSYYVLSASKQYLGSETPKSEINIYSIQSLTYYLTKYNSNNELIFNKIIDSCELDDCYRHRITMDGRGSLIYYNKMTTLANDDSKVILSSYGEIHVFDIVDNTISQVNMEGLKMEIYDLINDSYGGFLVVGKVFNYHKVAIERKATIAKFTNDYKLEWVNFIDQTKSFINTITQINDYYLVVGESFKANEPGEIYGTGSIVQFLAKYDNFGRLYWYKEINQLTNSIVKLSDGNVLLVGSTRKKSGISTNDHPINVASLKKINPHDGKLIWENDYSFKIPRNFMFTDALETSDKNIIATGKIIGPNSKSIQNDVAYQFIYEIDYTWIHEDRQGLIVMFNSDGNPQRKTILDNTVMYQVNQLNDGKILFTGNRYAEGYVEKLKKDYNQESYRKTELIGVYSAINEDEIEYEHIRNHAYLYYIGGSFALISLVTILFFKQKGNKINRKSLMIQ